MSHKRGARVSRTPEQQAARRARKAQAVVVKQPVPRPLGGRAAKRAKQDEKQLADWWDRHQPEKEAAAFHPEQHR